MSSTKHQSIAIVTGASRGIGKAIAYEFLQRGINVLGVSRSASTLESPTDAQFISCTADVTNPDDLLRILEAVQQTGMPVIALINNAGTLDPISKISNMDLDSWRQSFEVNVVAVIALTQRFLPMLRESNGRVINISSGAAINAYQGWSAYCASKAALNMVTQAIAMEEPDVVAIALRPGAVDTDMQKVIRSVGHEAMREDQFAKFQSLYSEGTLLQPELPARVVVRLALEAPKSMSGSFVRWNSPEIEQYFK